MNEWINPPLFSAAQHSRHPAQVWAERTQVSTCRTQLPYNSPKTLNMPGCIVEWLHIERGGRAKPFHTWKTRLKLLISRQKGQGLRQGGWKQSGLSSQRRTVKAPAPYCLKMFHQIWAALLYLYGILLNSIYQCPEHSQLTTQGVDGKEVWRKGGSL